ncbi:MAG TPA: ATP-binding protein [Chloroflexota bacterium]|nr:ATP-binding protein [Chloroflexota bacterium]
MRQAIFAVLAVASLLAILAADLTLWPGRNLPVLYAIPVLIAAVRSPPRFVYAMFGLSTVTDVLSFGLEVFEPHHPTFLWPLRFFAFLLAAGLAVSYARHRERLQKTRFTLEQTISILDSVLDATDNGIIMYDRRFIIRLVNDKLAGWLEVSPDKLIGCPLPEVVRDIVAPKVEVSSGYVAGFDEIWEHPEVVFRHEVVQVRPVRRVLRFYSGPVYHDGRLIGRIGVYTDITVQRREEQRAATQAREAEEARAHLQLFLSMVVHDLRGPVTVIQGYSQLMMHQAEQLSDRQRQGLRAIDSAAIRMRRLLSDLLDAARIGAGRFQIHPRRLNLVEVVAMAVQQEQATTTRHRISLTSPEWVMGFWDPERIGEVFSNLLSNAIKYSPQGGAVDVRLSVEGAKALACVTDHGIGLEPEQAERLFQPFARLPTERRIEGSGLGLYITKGIVEAHGGRIWVESAPGKGSTFCVSLPTDSRELPDTVA